MTDMDYLAAALAYGETHSSDPRTKVGTALLAGGKVLWGANRVPPGVTWTLEHKYLVTEHAERAVIYAAACRGVPTAGSRLYAPWYACTDCARAIILAGVKEVVGLASLREATPERWKGNIALADQMLAEAGVGLRWLAGEAGVTITFDGGQLRC